MRSRARALQRRLLRELNSALLRDLVQTCVGRRLSQQGVKYDEQRCEARLFALCTWRSSRPRAVCAASVLGRLSGDERAVPHARPARCRQWRLLPSSTSHSHARPQLGSLGRDVLADAGEPVRQRQFMRARQRGEVLGGGSWRHALGAARVGAGVACAAAAREWSKSRRRTHQPARRR